MSSSHVLSRGVLAGCAAILLATSSAWAKPVTLAYIANAGNNNVQILDVDTGETVNKLYTGPAPWRLVESPDEKRLVVQHWYAETTAVVDLATNRIETTLPVRGPGAFTPKGDRFWTYSWPGAFLRAYDGKTFKLLDQRQTEDRGVYEMLFTSNDRLYLGQYDPITKVGRQVYDNVLTVSANDPKAVSSSIPTGTSPARLVSDPTGDFVLSANVDGRDVSLINRNGATAKISLAPGPRDILFTRNGKRMIVICWQPGAAGSNVFTLNVDWRVKPWPEMKADLTVQTTGGLVAAALGPGGKTFYALDRPGKRLVIFDAETLKELKSIPVGDEPAALLIRQVSSRERARLAEKTEGRKRLEEAIAAVKAHGTPYTDVSFVETMTSEVPDLPAVAAGTPDQAPEKKPEEKPKTKTVTSTIKTTISLPDSVRQQFADGGIRLAQGGRVVSITTNGRYIDSPRQDLLYSVYGLHGLSTDEAVRSLAGDVPGSPYLRNGIAVDIARLAEEEGHRYYAIGALGNHEPVSQLWISAETGLPVSLVEQFPIMRTKSPHGQDDGFQGSTETRLQYQKVEGGFAVPVRMSRYLDGKEVGVVEVSAFAFNQKPSPDRFDLVRLGTVLKPIVKKPEPARVSAHSGPGAAVAGLGSQHVETPFDDHPAYNSNPPTSGPHTPYLADWGAHTVPIPQETQVHNLEDGGVLLQYSCPTPCPDIVKALNNLAMTYDRVIAAPYPLMEDRIALTAWERIETLNEFDDHRIRAFIEAYAGKDHHPAQGEGSSDASREKEKE